MRKAAANWNVPIGQGFSLFTLHQIMFDQTSLIIRLLKIKIILSGNFQVQMKNKTSLGEKLRKEDFIFS